MLKMLISSPLVCLIEVATPAPAECNDANGGCKHVTAGSQQDGSRTATKCVHRVATVYYVL